MTFTSYPGHLVVMALAAAFAAATFLAFHSEEARAPARRPWRWLLMAMQYIVIALLLAIAWDPSSLQTSEVFRRNTVVTLFDASGSMSVADADKAARLDKALAKYTACFQPDDAAGPQYRLYGFDRRAYHCGSPEMLRRWGAGTNLHTAVSLLADCATQEPPAGAVIFTDGRTEDRNIHSYPPPLPAGTPLLLVGVGSKTPRADVAIKSIAAPARAWIDTAYPLAVAVTGTNLSSEPLTVELLQDDQVVDARQITADRWKRSSARANTGEAALEFTMPAQQLGTHVLTVRATPCRNEVNTANNSRSTTVEVTQEQNLRVLLYSQQASFDVGKIRQSLAWNKRIDLDLRLDVIRDPVLAQRAAAGRSTQFPEDEGELDEFDLLILGPCDLGRFTPAQREALYRFVAERGGGLLLLPSSNAATLATWGDGQADVLLPVILDAQDRRFWPPAPDAIQPSFEAQISRIFAPQTFADPDQSLCPYYNVVRTKPAGTTLATVGDTPIISAHRLGRGRVGLLNAAKLFTLYREDRKGGTLADVIGGLASYLGATPSAATGIELFVERTADDPRRAAFSAYVTDKRFEPVDEANVLLHVGNQVVPMPPAGQGQYTAEIELGDAESVVATAQAEINGTFLGERTVAVNLPPVRDEMTETDLDEPFLKALAQKLGGRYIHVDDLDGRIAKTFEAKQQVGTTEKITSIWPRWPLLLTLCLLLSVKWFLRRSIGLV
jgi:hypothetical protein